MERFEIVNVINAMKKIRIPTEIEDRSDWVKYFTIPYWHDRVIDNEIIASGLDKRFNEVTEKYVNAYIFDKKEPPAEIAGAIMNIADDVLNGREPVLRAGDYISIQNYIKGTQ